MNLTISLVTIKRITLVILILSFVSLVVYFISQYGFIRVVSSDTNTTSVSLSSPGKTYTYKEYENGSIKLVKKSVYDMIIKSQNNSYFTNVSASGFFQTKTITADLKNVGNEKIMGTNPYNCSLISEGLFYSYICTDDVELIESANDGSTTLKKQIPAQDETPGYTEDINYYFQKTLAITEMNDSEFWMLTKAGLEGIEPEGSSQSQQIVLKKYTANNILQPVSSRVIDKNIMAMKQYKDGVILYSKDSVEAYYLSSFNEQLEKINFTNLEAIDGYGYEIEIYGEEVSYYYNNHTRDEKITTKIKNLPISVVTKFAEPKIIKTPYVYTYAFSCGNNMVCIGYDDSFIIRQDKGEKMIHKVYDYSVNGSSVLIQIDSMVVLYDVGDNSGTIVYQGNEYNTPCGIQSTFSGVRICVDAKKTGNLYSVQLDLKSPKNTNIIDVINQISENNYVDSVTVLGNIIYINDAVEPVYDETIDGYRDDPEESVYAEQSIRQTVSETGVDTNKYSVVIL